MIFSLFVQIQWIVSLLEIKLLLFDLLDVTANRFSQAIVFLANVEVELKMQMIMLAKCQKTLFSWCWTS